MKNIYALICGIAVITSSLFSQNLNNSIVSFPNELHVLAQGNNFGDEMVIIFREGATTGFDEMYDALKWMSPYEDATEIFSILDDSTKLTINSLPPLIENYSVNAQFKCGVDSTYSIIFEGLDSFEEGIEIWLEDLISGGNWRSITDQDNIYNFQGCPDDDLNRFVIHFMGPTGTEATPFESKLSNEVLIRASANYAIIETEHPELIRGIEIFDLVGNEIFKGRSDQDKTQRIYVSHQHGYYFVKVIAKTHVFTKKIFIGQ